MLTYALRNKVDFFDAYVPELKELKGANTYASRKPVKRPSNACNETY
jgi:hypothetical protein